MLSQIIKFIEDAQLAKPQIQKLADKVSGNFILIIHILALLVFLFWFFIGYDLFFVSGAQFMLSSISLYSSRFSFRHVVEHNRTDYFLSLCRGISHAERHRGWHSQRSRTRHFDKRRRCSGARVKSQYGYFRQNWHLNQRQTRRNKYIECRIVERRSNTANSRLG